MVELRAMAEDDLPLVDRWLRQPHVARWWLTGTTREAELVQLTARLSGLSDEPTQLLIVVERVEGDAVADSAIGWCQWYYYDAYPTERAALGARAGDCGIDYAIGDSSATGRGLGSQLIATLIDEVRHHHPGCGVVADPDASNTASRRVLERNGFSLLAVRPVATEPDQTPMAIYRLPGPRSPRCTSA
jgi:aminoglycoside 6'-N-acetyltransferase